MELDMQLLSEQRSHILPLDRERAWPLDARMAMFVLEAGGQDPQFIHERESERQACRIIATVCGQDPRSLTHSIVYVRDISDGLLGFICQSSLAVGKTVVLHCVDETGRSHRLPCRIGR